MLKHRRPWPYVGSTHSFSSIGLSLSPRLYSSNPVSSKMLCFPVHDFISPEEFFFAHKMIAQSPRLYSSWTVCLYAWNLVVRAEFSCPLCPWRIKSWTRRIKLRTEHVAPLNGLSFKGATCSVICAAEDHSENPNGSGAFLQAQNKVLHQTHHNQWPSGACG